MRTLKTLAALAAFALVAATATSCAVDNVLENIPDPVFRAYCEAQTAWDTDGDGKLSAKEAAAVTIIDVSDTYEGVNEGIKSLKGIEYFTGLTELNCYGNNLTALDVSRNTALIGLVCSINQLTSLDVSKNTALSELVCEGNQLTSLDVSKNAALTVLVCPYNQLTALDVSKNTALTTLFCWNNQLTALDVSQNTALIELWYDYNPGDGAGKFPVKVWPSFGTPTIYFTTDEWDYDGKTITPVYSE